MSLYNGTFSLTRYRVLGRSRRFTIADLNQNLHGYQARPVSLTSSSRELSSGWVIPNNPEHEDLDLNKNRWDISDCLYENGLLLRLRIERRSVSASLLQEMYRQRLPSLEAEPANEEPQRLRKKQLLDDLKEELLALSLPTINFIDAFWLDQDDCIYVFSQSKMALQCFEELFHHSFGAPLKISLFQITPPLLGRSLEAWQNPKADWIERLKRTLPSKSRTEPELGTQSI